MSIRRVRVGDVLQLQRRPVEIDPLAEYVSIGVRSFGKGIFHYPSTPGAELSKLRFFEIHPGELVVSNIKAWEGAIAVSDDSEAGTIGSNRFLSYVPRGDEVDIRYLRYFFLSEAGLPLIQKASPGSADRNRTLAIDRFEALEIPLPPIDEQRRIVVEIERWHQREAQIRSRLPRDFAATEALPGMIDSILGAGAAEAVRVGDLVEVVHDLVRPGDDPAPAASFVGLQHVESHTGRRIGEQPVGDEQGRKFRFHPGDIVYGYLRPYLNKVWVADRSGLCSVDQYVLRPDEGVSADYIAYAMRSRSTLDEANRLTHSLQLPRLRSGLLLDIRIPKPPRGVDDLVSRLSTATEHVLDLHRAHERRRSLLDAISPSVLNRWFGSLAEPRAIPAR